MRTLVLGPHVDLLSPLIGDHLVASLERPCTEADLQGLRIEALVSFGHRHIVSEEVLRAVDFRAVNLHISLLPWNRGADPNLWSWLEGTPKGVTVHWMVAGLDRGDVVARREVDLDPMGTLRSTYAQLQDEVLGLFAAVWPGIVEGSAARVPQEPGGTYHRAADKAAHPGAMPKGWDTICAEVAEYGRRAGLHVTSS